MKTSVRQFLLLVFCLFAGSASWAQTSIGLRAGSNFANFAVQDDENYPFRPKPGLSFAVLFNLPMSATTSIQLEPGFSQRGTRIRMKSEEMVNNQTVKIDVKGNLSVNYIELPILFQYRPKLGKLEGLFSIGPEVRLLMGNLKTKSTSKLYIDNELIASESRDETYSFGEDSRKFDFGMVGGAGLAYPLGALKIFAEGRYHFGLRNLATSVDGDNTKVYNRGASAHIGVLVPVGK
ncbi:porin family protein [Dyadobacter crusticola]|uniref:porin family protein n=1 Tax=Dyadobacter crusticola TaxID=292407 RepID=UPI0004E25BFB|nr:porin family protein [Dyadobacter crusticola]